MVGLCFGTYARAVQKVIKGSDSQVEVTELLLGLILDNVVITNQIGEPYVVTAKIANQLLGLNAQVHNKIKKAAGSKLIIDAAHDYFEDVVIPAITPDLTSDLVHELTKLISQDTKIPQNKKKEFLALAEGEKLARFLSEVFLYAIKKPNKLTGDKQTNGGIPTIVDEVKALKAILSKSHGLRPPPLTPPEEIQKHELTYVTKLLAAYAEAEKLTDLSKELLDRYPRYKKDFERRRKDYYAAETVRRDARDIFGMTEPDQFETLKEETYNGIIDIYYNDFKHGFARMNGVMAHAAVIQVNKCWLCEPLKWVGASEKKGVCHILVNDGEIEGWVLRNE